MPKVIPPQTKHTSNGDVNFARDGLAKSLQKIKAARRTEPLWKGPSGEGPLGGVTQSLLGRYLACPERCRLYVIEGLSDKDKFHHRMEYGNLFHTAEEATALNKDWKKPVAEYAKKLLQQWPTDTEQITHWYNVLLAQYPIYLNWWSKRKEEKKRKPFYAEEIFDEPLKLPSGRTVRLRGKWDSVSTVGKQIYLGERKARGEIIKEQMLKELRFDLQIMTYLVALEIHLNQKATKVRGVALPLGGAFYRVIRRPLAGGKYSIKQKKGQTTEEYYKELGDLIKNDPEWFFFSWHVDLLPTDIADFRLRCLHPVLENLCDDYEWWKYVKIGAHNDNVSPFDYRTRERLFPGHRHRHFLLPFGVYNPTAKGETSYLDEAIITGDTKKLTHVDTLFRELQ